MVSEMPDSESFPFYTASGGHHELGLQHGEQARSRIAAHLESLQRSSGLATSDFEARALAFTPLFDMYCPHLLAEIRGLAAGASISFAGALAVNIRGALGTVPDEGCTAIVAGRDATANGEVLIGQNSDMLQQNTDYAYLLRLEPDGKPAMLMWTFGGMIGYHGINSAGVAQMANDLGEGGPAKRFAMPHYPVKRMMFECRSVAEIVALLERVPLWFNGNYVLCDGDGTILDVEATSAGPEIIGDGDRGYIAHSNHYCSDRYASAENAAATYPDSFPRLARANALLDKRAGRLTVDDLKVFFADHDGFPSSICRHSQAGSDGIDFVTAGVTVASLIAEPEHGRLHVAVGNPCQTPYETFCLNS
jgi:isopenicillin-N N-acyltransferase like protein